MHCLRDVLPVEIIVQILQQLDVDSILNAVETGLLGHYEEDEDDGDVIDVYISGRIGIIGWVDSKGIVHQEHSCVKPKFATTLKLYSKDRYKGRRRRRRSGRELCYDVCTVSLLSLLRYVHLEHSDGTVMCLLLASLPSSVHVLEVFITGALKGRAPNTNTNTDTFTTPALKMFTIVNINVWNQRRVARAVGWSARKVRHCIAEAQQHGGAGAGAVAEEALVAQLSRTDPPLDSSPVSVSVLALVRVQLQRMLLQCAATVHNVGVFGFDIAWIMPSAGIEPPSPSFRELRLVRVGGDSMARLYTWLALLIPRGSPKRDFPIPTGPTGLKKLSPVVVVGGGLLGLGNSNNICKVVAADGRCVLVGGTGHDLLMRYTYTTQSNEIN
jgi:hypothetical protein